MTEHEDVRIFGNLMVGKDFGVTEQEADEVERMDIEV
jgi:hypothetical protein